MTESTFAEPEANGRHRDVGPRLALTRWSVVAAAGWGVSCAMALAAGGAFGLILVRHQLRREDYGSVLGIPLDAVPEFAIIGGIYGLLTGTVAGLLRGGRRRVAATVGWALGGLAIGAAGGGLIPPVVAATDGLFRVEVGFVVGLATAGFLAGLIGYTLSRTSKPGKQQAPEDEWSEHDLIGIQESPPVADQPSPVGSVGRVLPTLLLALIFLAASLLTPPSEIGRAILAVGLLGLFVAWALIGQERHIRRAERRIRELERRLRIGTEVDDESRLNEGASSQRADSIEF